MGDEHGPQKTEILAGLACPGCGRTLTIVTPGGADMARGYHCPGGHTFSVQGLAAQGGEPLREALAKVLHAWEERSSLLRSMMEERRKAGEEVLASDFARTADDLDRRTEVIRETLRAA
jgi:hypothetical protein